MTPLADPPGGSGSVSFRLWPPVAIGAPLLVGWLVTRIWGDPVELGGWRVPVGWVLVLAFAVWNGWALWLFGRHGTGLLPGQPTHAIIDEGPYRLSRNPLYVGMLALYAGLALLAPTLWGCCSSLLRCCWSPGARSGPRSASCTSGSGRRTTTMPGGSVAGCDRPGTSHAVVVRAATSYDVSARRRRDTTRIGPSRGDRHVPRLSAVSAIRRTVERGDGRGG